MSTARDSSVAAYVLWTDESEDSELARELVEEWARQHAVSLTEFKDGEGADVEGVAPVLSTPVGPYEGIQAIRAVLRDTPERIESAAELYKQDAERRQLQYGD